MKKYNFLCSLLSDVVIKSTAATEGFNDSLDYIPGAKFLGIAAKLYDEKNETQTMDLFHNGNVRFGDAYPLVKNEVLLPIPFSWYETKSKTDNFIYLHHKLSETKDQLKQIRNGYFLESDYSSITIEQGFSIKSAHDSEKRRSKDGQMFGYYCLKKGTKWLFSLELNNDKNVEILKNALTGVKRIGRSKSAEYGLVDISFHSEQKQNIGDNLTGKILVYAKSNLCFYNEHGQTTSVPTIEQLIGSQLGVINWQKSQVRARKYLTWNGHRNNKDSERVIIEKGSVFFVETEAKINTEVLLNGIGSHLNEGFGKVLFNPVFLNSEKETLSINCTTINERPEESYVIESGDKVQEQLTLSIIKNIDIRKNMALHIDNEANMFIVKNKNTFLSLSKSQWGSLRNIAQNSSNYNTLMELVFNEKTGFVHSGISQAEWKQKNRNEVLKAYLIEIEKKEEIPTMLLIEKICIIMPKQK